MRRSDILKAHLATAERDVVIGVDDCGPWVAQWIKAACGREIKFPHYRTREDVYALINRAGGLVELVAPLMAAAGLSRTDCPEYGDVLVIRLSDRDTAGIMCEGGNVLFRGELRSATFMRPRAERILAAWQVPESVDS